MEKIISKLKEINEQNNKEKKELLKEIDFLRTKINWHRMHYTKIKE